jgi:hypothetical protein
MFPVTKPEPGQIVHARNLRSKTEKGQEMLMMDNNMARNQFRSLFAGMTAKQLKQADLELAVTVQHGLNLKDPTPKHTLKAFPGALIGMKIVSDMVTVFQQFMPALSSGIELSKECAVVVGR